MKIAVTGAKGMLGTVLCPTLGRNNEVHPSDIDTLDITDLRAVQSYLRALKPDWVVHAAAYTNVDKAEKDQLLANRVNGMGTRNVAQTAAEIGARFLYFSTDYVFDGRSDRPYREWDTPNPINEYGRSKLAGEFYTRSLCPRHVIVRTSWLFGPGGVNFVRKILERARTLGKLRVVIDQRGSPTFTRDLAETTLCLIQNGRLGTYHVSNSGDCNWFQFAEAIVSQAGIQAEIEPVTSSAFPSPARRPVYSVLDNYLLKCEGVRLPADWRDALQRYLSEMQA